MGRKTLNMFLVQMNLSEVLIECSLYCIEGEHPDVTGVASMLAVSWVYWSLSVGGSAAFPPTVQRQGTGLKCGMWK